MAIRVGFGGGYSGGTFGAGTAYSDGIPLPNGRAMANGDSGCYIVELYGYVRGNGGSRQGRFRLEAGGGATMTDLVTITAHSDSYPGSGYFSVPSWYVDGGVARFSWIGPSSGTSWIGKGGSGSVHGVFGTRSGTLGGAYGYIQAPTAPRSPSLSAGSSEATLSWVAPSDNGGALLQGYRVQYGTDPNFAGATTVDVGVVTSHKLTGLTPGATYYFRVAARNTVTSSRGTSSLYSGTVSASLGAPPDAPGKPSVAVIGNAIEAAWAAPGNTGGAPLLDYTLEHATTPDFSGGLGSTVVPASVTRATIPGLDPSTTYHVRVKARNSIGTSAPSVAAVATTHPRDGLDLARGASVNVGGATVSIRSDGAADPTLVLGYTAFGTGTAFTPIATLPTGASAGELSVIGGTQALALAADPAGNLYVIGADGAATSSLLVKRYAKTGAASWAAAGSLSQALPSTGSPLAQFAATYVPGSGVAPVPSLLVLARRAGTLGAGSLSYATVNLANLAASAGALFLNYGSNPSWLAVPPVGQPHNSGLLDAATLTATGSRVAILADGFAVVDVTNGVVAGVSKAPSGSVVPGLHARILGVNATTFVVLAVVDEALTWSFYGANGAALGSGGLPGADAQGGEFRDQWDAYVNRVTGQVVAYYVPASSPLALSRVTVSPATYAATAPVVVTAALGAASSVNGGLRVPRGTAVDERRIVVEAANDLAGAKSVAVAIDTSGNQAPSAPGLVNLEGFDASLAQVFGWSFGDPNPLDAQSAYALQVQRVSDSVNVIDTGKVVSTSPSRQLAAGTLVNGIDYRWRVRTYDELDALGSWSSYDTFTTSALGSLTITQPAADNPPGVDVSSYLVTWGYAQGDGYTQTQRRVRVLQGATVLSDSGMQASTEAAYTVDNLPSDVELIIEVSLTTNAPGSPVVTATRRLTTSYSSPMTPELVLELAESYVIVTVVNPTPTGARPDIVANSIERRPADSDAAFTRIAVVERNGIYLDHAVASGAAYDYRVIGVTA